MRGAGRAVRLVVMSSVLALSCLSSGVVSTSSAGAVTGTAFYLDIGGSGSLGVQPTTTVPKGQRTDQGYADYLVTDEASKGVTLSLYQIGCPGETTGTMLYGGDHCYAEPDSQLLEAVTFLRAHYDESGLVTVDLGFNDLRPCFHDFADDHECVHEHLSIVSQQLAQVLSLLKNAAGPNVKFVGVGHYDPYLARYFDNAGGVADAKESLGVVRHLDRTLDDVYQSFSIPMANVGQAFNIDGTQSVAIEGLGTVPENVAEVCLLTWMCQPAPMGPNIHPNDAGYEAIAGSIEQVLTPW